MNFLKFPLIYIVFLISLSANSYSQTTELYFTSKISEQNAYGGGIQFSLIEDEGFNVAFGGEYFSYQEPKYGDLSREGHITFTPRIFKIINKHFAFHLDLKTLYEFTSRYDEDGEPLDSGSGFGVEPGISILYMTSEDGIILLGRLGFDLSSSKFTNSDTQKDDIEIDTGGLTISLGFVF